MEDMTRGYFHRWGDVVGSDGYRQTRAIVELEDGRIRCVPPEDIRFVDIPRRRHLDPATANEVTRILEKARENLRARADRATPPLEDSSS
jgi:hypothetical protein